MLFFYNATAAALWKKREERSEQLNTLMAQVDDELESDEMIKMKDRVEWMAILSKFKQLATRFIVRFNSCWGQSNTTLSRAIIIRLLFGFTI